MFNLFFLPFKPLQSVKSIHIPIPSKKKEAFYNFRFSVDRELDSAHDPPYDTQHSLLWQALL